MSKFLNFVRVFLENGEDYVTPVSAETTEQDAFEYFVGSYFVQSDEVTALRCVKIEYIKG